MTGGPGRDSLQSREPCRELRRRPDFILVKIVHHGWAGRFLTTRRGLAGDHHAHSLIPFIVTSRIKNTISRPRERPLIRFPLFSHSGANSVSPDTLNETVREKRKAMRWYSQIRGMRTRKWRNRVKESPIERRSGPGASFRGTAGCIGSRRIIPVMIVHAWPPLSPWRRVVMRCPEAFSPWH